MDGEINKKKLMNLVKIVVRKARPLLAKVNRSNSRMSAKTSAITGVKIKFEPNHCLKFKNLNGTPLRISKTDIDGH